MNINIQKFYENYKEIVQVCAAEGILLPQKLSFLIRTMPSKYDLSPSEGEIIYNRMSDKNIEKATNLSMLRRKKEREIYETFSDDNERRKAINKLELDELTKFIERFPQFEDIIN